LAALRAPLYLLVLVIALGWGGALYLDYLRFEREEQGRQAIPPPRAEDSRVYRFGAEGPLVAFVIGHNALQQGAFSEELGVSEYVQNQAFAFMLANQLSLKGVRSLIVTRPAGPDYRGQIYRVAEIVTAANPALALHLHFNASGEQQLSGSLVLIGDRASQASVDLAEALAGVMAESLGLPDLGVEVRYRDQRGYVALSAHRVPTLLLEPFFGDNPTDVAAYRANALTLVQALADAIAAAVKQGP